MNLVFVFLNPYFWRLQYQSVHGVMTGISLVLKKAEPLSFLNRSEKQHNKINLILTTFFHQPHCKSYLQICDNIFFSLKVK